MYKVKVLDNKIDAGRIANFLTSDVAFEQEWAPGEKEMVKKQPYESLERDSSRFWFVEKSGDVIAALGVFENEFKSGGYGAYYFAIHENFRRQGIGSGLLETSEKYIKENNGRYLIIESCDIDSYRPARNFYQKNGYTAISYIPDYYVIGEGRIDYYKRLC